MPSNTSRLALVEPLGADGPSELRLSITNHATTLDNAAIYEEGTLVSRGTPAYNGQLFKTTDSGAETLSWYDGAHWLPLGMIPQISASNISVLSGQAILTNGSSPTITLPSHAAGQLVTVVNQSSGVTTVSGSNIQGPGASSVSSIPLGTLGAFVTLLDDGTNWHVISGQQDSGWTALTAGSNISSSASIRQIGDRILFKGSLSATGNVTTGSAIATWANTAIATPPASTFIGTSTTPIEFTSTARTVFTLTAISVGALILVEGLAASLS